jgi:hypothetical protein
MHRSRPLAFARLLLTLLLVPGLALALAPRLHASPGLEVELCGPSGQRLVLGPDGQPALPRPPCPDCLPGPVFAALPPVLGLPSPQNTALWAGPGFSSQIPRTRAALPLRPPARAPPA